MSTMFAREPAISVGILQDVPSVAIRTIGAFTDDRGHAVAEGEHQVAVPGTFVPASAAERFELETVIGIDFHWEQKERQRFAGSARIIASGRGLLTVVNDVPLETYLESVICSEMSSTAAPDLLRAHAVIARSWLLAQIERRGQAPASVPAGKPVPGGEWIRWYDRESHAAFDVCADDHCQRYQGVSRIDNPQVLEAARATRGLVLVHDGHVCDARYSKACGGVTEDFRAAWGEENVPYLVPVRDWRTSVVPDLTTEAAMRAWLDEPPAAWCNCRDNELLDTFLPSYDRATHDFYRWTVPLSREQAGALVRDKLGVDLGNIVALKPVERAASGRLVRLELVGERGSMVIGKELEIRRALSPKHLYSSAFVVDESADGFVLRGAGWGHGVGLCQIGAAVMAAEGVDYASILRHYYPGAELERIYS